MLLTAIVIVIQVIVSLLLIGMILLHSGKGGGLVGDVRRWASGRRRPDPPSPSATSTGPRSPAPSCFFFTTIILAIRLQ